MNTALQLYPGRDEWAIIREQAQIAVCSGFLPSAIRNANQAITIALKGRELGIPMMQAFTHIHIIKGKPTISAELMLSLILREEPNLKIEYPDYSAEKVTVKVKGQSFSWTIQEARDAGLLDKDNWKNYPRAMLRSRAISEMARSLFPHRLMGCSYTPEELDPGAQLNEDGEVINVTPEPTPGTQQADVIDADTEPDQKPPKVYRGTTEQQQVIKKMAEQKGIDEMFFEEVHQALIGKDLNIELEKTLNLFAEQSKQMRA